MSLINPAVPPSVVQQIKQINTLCLYTMKSSAKQVFQLLWHSASKTPQEVCDMLGADAGAGFSAHGQLQALIYALDPTWVPLVPPAEYVVNEDGTVTITGDPQ